MRTIAKIYDPLGLITPVTLCGKLLFQELCRGNISWDEKLPDDLLKTWKSWTTDAMDQVMLLRSSLIGLCDGSTKAYAAVIYLRNELENGKMSSMLIGSKVRVAPLEKIGVSKYKYTVPRLELLGCMILSHFMETVVKSLLAAELKIYETRFYTDSTISLCRIKGKDKEFKQWVQHRVSGIRNKTSVDDWYYVPTKLNASDLPSRGCSLKDLKSHEEWIHGPEFIREKEIKLFELKTSADVETEFKISCLLATEEESKVTFTGLLPKDYFKNLNNKAKLHEIIDISRFSKLKRLLNVTAYVTRFASSTETGDLSAEGLEKVKLMWIASEQENKEMFTKTGNNLNFILYNDIIRCKGRITNADLPYSTKFPIYLPVNSYFTQLIIKDAHDEVYHQKITVTLTQVRTEYWMPRVRQIVKKVISSCGLCRLYDSSPYKPSAVPDLPRFRVEIVPPFHNIGTDHAGPRTVCEKYL